MILELNNLSSATNHNGGALAFGPDGKLYAAVGENANGTQRADAEQPARQDAAHQRRRHDPDRQSLLQHGDRARTAPSGRSACATRSRSRSAPADGMFINDVGQSTWEEINDGIAGSNYGWPTTEGTTSNPTFRAPRYTYSHSGGACAITGGAFYSPLAPQFPADYVGRLFLRRLLRRLDPQAGCCRRQHGPATFATGISFPVDLKVSDDGRCTTWRAARAPRPASSIAIEYGNAGADASPAPVEPDRRAGRVRDVQRASVRPAAAAVSVAAQRRQHPGRHGAGLHDRQRRPVGQRRTVPRAASATTSATRSAMRRR